MFYQGLLKKTLRVLTKLTIKKFQPLIIGVTGTVGKSSTKRAIATVLSVRQHVRADEVSLNTEFGFPLSVLGNYSEHDLRHVRTNSPPGHFFEKFCFWLRVVLVAKCNLLFLSRKKFPEVLVLEYGADKPGDIGYLTELAAPATSVVTAVGEIPAHAEFYSNAEAVAHEKGKLVEAVSANGRVILNADDRHVLAMRTRAKAPVMTYGFTKGSSMLIENFETKIDGDTIGIVFKLGYEGNVVPVRLSNTAGRAQAYVAAAAACVGVLHGLNLVEIVKALANYEPPSHRLNVIKGKNDTTILDDSYNASPLSMQNALEALVSINAKRKVAILGDMRELGEFTKRAHEIIGMQAGQSCDLLIAVGPNAKIIAQAAERAGLAAKHIVSFEAVSDAMSSVQNLLKPGDLILIKASLAIGLTKLVEALRT